jgi:hypothetical protein
MSEVACSGAVASEAVAGSGAAASEAAAGRGVVSETGLMGIETSGERDGTLAAAATFLAATIRRCPRRG